MRERSVYLVMGDKALNWVLPVIKGTVWYSWATKALTAGYSQDCACLGMRQMKLG